MRQSALLLLLLCKLVSGQKLEGPVTVILAADQPVSSSVLRGLQHEAYVLVSQSRINLNWQMDRLTNPGEVALRLASIRLRGNCAAVPAPPAPKPVSTQLDTLGQTQVVEGKVLPFADINCEAVRRVLDRDLRTADMPHEEMLGRALGRVIAHELYHILLRTRTHGKAGLAKPLISSGDLVVARYTFAPEDERRLAESTPELVETGR